MSEVRQLPQPVSEAWDWQLIAACRGVDTSVFYAPDSERGLRRLARERVAKAICASCPVIEMCRDHALQTREPFGVWGGLTADERRDILSPMHVKSA